MLLAAVVGGGIGAGVAGPVAAVVLAAYGALGMRAVLRRHAGRHAQRARRQSLDQLGGLAADLRAGLPVTAALGGAASGPVTFGGSATAALTFGGLVPGRSTLGETLPGQPALGGPVPAPSTLDGSVLAASGRLLADGDLVVGPPPPVEGPASAPADGETGSAGHRSAADGGGRTRSPGGTVLDRPERVAELARAAVRLADRTGAPLAELLERIEADARAADRGLAAAAAQAAGARATAWLLAALPLGGIGLGYAIGVDPVAVLLRTPVGGASAVAAVALQIGGLLWAERLGAAPGRAG
ncbi:hypothetical protein GA0070613_1486 [Micromonospora inositola]|uniref:Tight adherence protein B n=1 Tax=Micromonospora inositola TaxID=47865 RepID=A0A1C5HKU4_9ACTN|nr:hypothetical protein GA0070613_1486 [Micromonospora inositola]